MAHSGEDVILKSRAGSVRLMPVGTAGDILSIDDRMAIEKARSLSGSDLEQMRKKEYLTIEESQTLLLKMVDEEYDKP